MSHYTVSVCLLDDGTLYPSNIEQAIRSAMHPYYEGRDDIEPWKCFEEDAPEEFWWVKAVRRDAAHHHAGTVDERWIKREAEESLPFSERWGANRREPTEAEIRAAEEKIRAENAEDAEWAARLGDNPTWKTVAELYNAKWHPGNQVAVNGAVDPDEVDTERMHYDEETDRAYTWSTSNPYGKWDWLVIGGRWQRGMIATKDALRDFLVFGEAGSGGDNGAPHRTDSGQICCDGGPVTMLDFDAMRERDAAAAADRFDRAEALAANHEPAKGWSHFRALAEAGEIDWDTARKQYHAQPLIATHDEIPYEHSIVGFGGCVVDDFAMGRDVYVQQARDAAVPGYALLDLDGNWIEPGRMGMFGVSHADDDDRVAYYAKASEYLDNLPANAWVVKVDCHT